MILVRPVAVDEIESLNQRVEILFISEPSDIQEKQLIGPYVEFLTPFFIPAARCKTSVSTPSRTGTALAIPHDSRTFAKLADGTRVRRNLLYKSVT